MYVDTIAFTNDRTAEAKALINRAANLLECYGWVKGAYCRPTGYCLVGALLQAGGRNPVNGTIELSVLDNRALCAAINLVAAQLPRAAEEEATSENPHLLHSRIEIWNDNPRRTKKQVLAILRKSAA